MSIINESLTLNAVYTENGVITDITGATAFFDYFFPGNATGTKDGTWTGIIDVGDQGAFHYDIPEGELSRIGKWRTQPYVIKDGAKHTAIAPTCFDIIDIGGAC